MYIKLKIVLIITLFFVNTLLASEVGFDDIHKDSYFIQVGAFKSISNTNKVIKRLSKYDVYLEPYKDMNRVHVVNVMRSSLKSVLRNIRKSFPNSFVVRRKIYNSNKNEFSTSSEQVNTKLFKVIPQNVNNIQQNTNILDSKSIIKTRKSFL